VEELLGNPTVRTFSEVRTRGQNERSSVNDCALERLRCGTIQKELSLILQRVSALRKRCKNNSPVLSCIGNRRL